MRLTRPCGRAAVSPLREWTNTVKDNFLKWPLETVLEWKAGWIAPSQGSTEVNSYFRARKKWALTELPASAIVHIAVESRYRLSVNGIEVGLGPVRGTSTVLFFDSYDISKLLRLGDNWLAIDAHSPNVRTFKSASAHSGILVQLDDGEIVTSDTSWETQWAPGWRSDVGLYTFQIGFQEWRDLGREVEGWQTGKGESGWAKATLLSESEILDGKALRPRDIPALNADVHLPSALSVVASVPPIHGLNDVLIAKIMSEEPHRPFSDVRDVAQLFQAGNQPAIVYPPEDGGGVVLIFDFNREINGGFEIEIEGPEGTVVDIAHDECLRDNRLPVIVNSYAFADRYILGAGKQTVGNVFAERGFRMVQVVLRNFSSPLKIHSVKGIDRTYPFGNRGTFVSSDPLLNDIWKVCAATISACATDTFVDCPWRENAFYLNDMVVENATSLQAFGDSRFNARCFRLAASQVRENGLLMGPAPFGLLPGMSETASADHLTFLSTNLFLPLMLEEYLLYSGDLSLVSEMIENATRALERFSCWENEDGLVCPPKEFWNFFDWSYEINNVSLTDRNTAVFNWFYVQAIECLLRLNVHLGRKEDSHDWQERALRTAKSADRIFWNETEQCYAEWVPQGEEPAFFSQVSQAAALLSGRYPTERKAALVTALWREDFLEPELYMQHYRLRALAQAGETPKALAAIRKFWGRIVLSGSRTIWECGVHQFGKSAYGGAGSICHGFSTTPIDFFQRTILGVRPTAPGFSRCLIDPSPIGLTHAKGTVPTPHGTLDVAWNVTGKTLALELRIPHGVQADLIDGRSFGPGLHSLEISLTDSDLCVESQNEPPALVRGGGLEMTDSLGAIVHA